MCLLHQEDHITSFFLSLSSLSRLSLVSLSLSLSFSLFLFLSLVSLSLPHSFVCIGLSVQNALRIHGLYVSQTYRCMHE